MTPAAARLADALASMGRHGADLAPTERAAVQQVLARLRLDLDALPPRLRVWYSGVTVAMAPHTDDPDTRRALAVIYATAHAVGRIYEEERL